MQTVPGAPSAQDLAAAFARGTEVDLGGATVAAQDLATLLLAAPSPEAGRVATLRLRDAVVTGVLDLAYGQVDAAVHCTGCRFEHPPRLVGATTRTVDLRGCELPGLQARLARVGGDLRLPGSTVTGPVNLENAEITGSLDVSGARLSVPGGRALSAGGVVVGGGVVGRGGLVVTGETRLIGARVGGGLLLDGATLDGSGGTGGTGGTALCLDDVETNRLSLAAATLDGELRLRGRGSPGSSRWPGPGSGRTGASGPAASSPATSCSPRGGDRLVDLSRAQVGALRDSVATWPPRLRLDGLTYDQLLAAGPAVDVHARCRWLTLDPSDYRPQPYEQLAEYYRRLGHDDDARRVLLAKERRRRATLGPVRRTGGYLLDGLVGYGYRAWLAGVWLACSSPSAPSSSPPSRRRRSTRAACRTSRRSSTPST